MPGMIPYVCSCCGKGPIPEMLLAPVTCVRQECHLGAALRRLGRDPTSGIPDGFQEKGKEPAPWGAVAACLCSQDRWVSALHFMQKTDGRLS